MADNLQTKTKKLIKYANEKFGTNETDLRSIIDNAEIGGGGEYNLESVLLEDGTQRMVATFVGEKGEELTIELPADFISTTPIFSFQVDDDTILFSATVTAIGLWSYSIRNNSFEKILTRGGSFSYFQIINEDVCLISSSTTNNNNSGGVVLYDIKAKTASWKYSSGASWDQFTQIGDDWLIGATSSAWGSGVLLYENSTRTITKKYTSGYNFTYHLVENDCLISGYNATGVLLYESSTKTITKKYENGIHWIRFQNVNTDCLIGSDGSSDTGILLYESSTKTITKKYEEGYYWRNFKVVKDGCFISGASSNSVGLLLYDSSTKTITKKYEGYDWLYFKEIGDICLISSNSTSSDSRGVLLYDGETKTVEQITTLGAKWSNFNIVGDICLIAGNDSYSTGMLSFNIPNRTVKVVITRGASNYGWTFIKNVGNDCLISTEKLNMSDMEGLHLYNGEVDTVTRLMKYGYGYDKAKEDSVGNYYVEASDKEKSKYGINYDSTAKTAKIVKYYIGKV